MFADLVGHLYLLRGEFVWEDDAMFLLKVNGFIAGAIAIGDEVDEWVEEEVSDDVEVGYVVWQEGSIPCHHAGGLLGDVISN